ncbi:hypothetical protein NDU88_006708 [Pleurodeles waltl]|uniref:Uncharacterized protein n=1 Tax=Pleurodeles waltl TaxID=8319 RepID=A0AAV7ULS8_PLEWA|nr:hypothetical protein NDU88_006708 [Pleurodeles waltl]
MRVRTHGQRKTTASSERASARSHGLLPLHTGGHGTRFTDMMSIVAAILLASCFQPCGFIGKRRLQDEGFDFKIKSQVTCLLVPCYD